MPEAFFDMAQLRARSLRLREMAEEFFGEDVERHPAQAGREVRRRADVLKASVSLAGSA
jgi:hypothetical protein